MRLLLAILLLAPPSPAQEKVRMKMRDGTGLSALVFRPAAKGRLPALLVRTPYNKGTQLNPSWKVFLDHGYSIVVQDVRGRYESEGTFRPLNQETTDGEDTLNWIAAQPWSNGRVGMFGGSYLGIVQWKAALSQNPHLKAIFPVVSGYDDYFDRFYGRGGALKLGHRLLWMAENLRAQGYQRPPFLEFALHLPLRTTDQAATGRRIDFWQTALNHPSYDSFWKSVSTRERLDRVRVPAFIVTGWYDNYAQSDLEAFSALRQRSDVHRIVVGPWAHDMSIKFNDVDFGPEAAAPIRRYQVDWFAQWLKGSPKPAMEAPMRLFVMGLNKWRDEQEWPLRRTQYTPYYLSSRTLVTEPRRSAADEYTYDPRNPVPTLGGSVCCNPKYFPWGPMDQRKLDARPDVLIYTTPVLTRDVEVTGLVRAVLYVSTSAPDTDFTAKLVDVGPDGFARNLCDGILRLRYRNGVDRPSPATPGELYQVTIDAGVTSNLFLAGHRIRLEISSSNFPRFDRNLNTGRPNADEKEIRSAKQKIYHGRAHPSHVLLPVIPR